jgi:hypothetical protein
MQRHGGVERGQQRLRLGPQRRGGRTAPFRRCGRVQQAVAGGEEAAQPRIQRRAVAEIMRGQGGGGPGGRHPFPLGTAADEAVMR